MNDTKPMEEPRLSSPSIRKLVWRRFTQHKMGVLGAVLIILLSLLAVLADTISPYQPGQQYRAFGYAPPTTIRFFDDEGKFSLPFVYGIKRNFDQKLGVPVYVEDTTQKFP